MLYWARIENAFSRANGNVKRRLDEIRRRALRDPTYDFVTAILNLDWNAEYGSRLLTLWEPAVHEAALAAALKELRVPSDGTISIAERVTRTYSKGRMAQRVVDIQDGTRRALQGELMAGINAGEGIDKVAKRLENLVGLTDRHNEALKRFAARKTEEGLTGAKLERAIEAKRRQLLRWRTTTIARTEINAAIGNGKLAAWQAQQLAGELPSTAMKKWMVGPETGKYSPCPICKPMEGQMVRLDQPFTTGDGSQVMTKPSHPRCRCVVVVVPFPDEQ